MVLRRAEREAMANVDSAWLRMEDATNLMTITGLMTFETPPDFARFKEVIEDRLMCHDRFRSKVVESLLPLGRPSWVEDDHFSLHAHLHRLALPSPHNQAALQELVSDLMSTPLDRSRPLWQMHLVENYGTGGALIIRLHHCIADGIALVRLLFSLTDEEAEPAPGQRAAGGEARGGGAKGRGVADYLLAQGREVLLNPARLAEMAESGASFAHVVGELLSLPLDPKTVFKGRIGITKKAVWSGPVPLADVKAVGRAFGATINDVLLAAATGAMRYYMLSRGDDIEGRDVKAIIPVNLRPEEDLDDLGNRFGLVFVALPVGLAEPRRRLAEVHRRMDELKRSPQAGVAFSILQLLGMAKPELLALGVDLFGSKATLVMTNVPGPQKRLFVAGSRIENIMFWVPQSAHLGLGISIFSYAGEVRMGLAVDAALAPDPERLVDHFHDEIEVLLQESRSAAAK
ncbi:MAG: wax ester/triacylglycerol synthase family O-acyltransferase [Acidobacteria bacterium]|nr:wax ester/triacylglycerol synthase family O-acyltransferase [Acidobacteriota bacterium]